ncbi:MAG TPA: SpoIIE family protein phosphatase [Bacteroidales bacterium]|nr:SpoIIE family protein phosphatase [Bacteroidales bacterium]
MKHNLILAVLAVLVSATASPQSGIYPVSNFTTKEYGRDFHPSNSAICQDRRGVIYAANSFKLMEFDGSSWKSYPTARETWILSMAVDSNGIIYTGSQDDFGFFVPDKKGELKYHSLAGSLKPGDLNFTNIWKVHAFSGGVVFQSEMKLFLYRNGRISTINPESSFHTSFVVNNKFYVRQRGHGLMKLADSSLVKIKGSDVFDTTGIFLMLPFGKSKDKVLIGTRGKGFWLMTGSNGAEQFTRFQAAPDDILNRAIITTGCVTGDGQFAVGTIHDGIVIFDSTGIVLSVMNTAKGLPDNEVRDMILDSGKNLWAALNNGISRIEVNSPLMILDERSGIKGGITCVIRSRGLLYTGTTNGLFREEPQFEKFSAVPGIHSAVRSVADARGTLVAATDEGVFAISGSFVKIIDPDEAYALCFYKPLNLLFAGGLKGLRTYSCDPPFREIGSLQIKGEDILAIAAEKGSGKGDALVWLGTRYNGVVRLKIEKGILLGTESFRQQDGLPEGSVTPVNLGKNILFETGHGIYGFTDENIVRESLPDSLKNNSKFVKGFFSPFNEFPKYPGESVSSLKETQNKIWACIDNNLAYFDKNDSNRYVDRPFKGMDAGKITTIYPEGNGISWIGTTEGLYRYDENSDKNYDLRYPCLVRKITLTDHDSALFLGTAYEKSGGLIRITSMQSPGAAPTVGYQDNSLRIEYAASFYEYPGKTSYLSRMKGRSDKWSSWSRENFQAFTNLKEGSYSFEVKARNIYGTESDTATFSFTILPPWYRTWPAYFAYGFAALVLFWMFARLYSYRLKRENIRLEGIITERTAEIVRQKDEIVHQKKEIEDSIRYAMRIQTAVLPSEKVRNELFPDSFVLFRPLNIVSGDFYWISKVGDKTIYTAADCTGHGVPGAFMSMLGVAFLNEIVNKDNITSPDEILSQLREKVIQALQQHGASGEARDGMDMALVSINSKENILEYAGAYNPLIMIRNGDVSEIPADKMPVGFYENMQGFRKHQVRIERGDTFYLYSDGYEDQFGGPDGKKFKSKRLKELLLSISGSPPENQKEILEKSLDDWKGDLPQIDDIVVVGIRIA